MPGEQFDIFLTGWVNQKKKYCRPEYHSKSIVAKGQAIVVLLMPNCGTYLKCNSLITNIYNLLQYDGLDFGESLWEVENLSVRRLYLQLLWEHCQSGLGL